MGLTAIIRTCRTTPSCDGSNAGTGPEDRGSTGWTGGNREQMKGGTTTGAGVSGSDPAADQPQMGSGADLNGPPIRFPANKTPE